MEQDTKKVIDYIQIFKLEGRKRKSNLDETNKINVQRTPPY
jgi:hypothetical protein